MFVLIWTIEVKMNDSIKHGMESLIWQNNYLKPRWNINQIPFRKSLNLTETPYVRSVGDPWHETLFLCLFPSILEMRIDEYRVANFYLYDNEL